MLGCILLQLDIASAQRFQDAMMAAGVPPLGMPQSAPCMGGEQHLLQDPSMIHQSERYLPLNEITLKMSACTIKLIPPVQCSMMTDLNSETDLERRSAERKKFSRRRKTGDKGPKLSVLNVTGTVVECQLDTGKQKTVTFKFDCEDLVPTDVAKNLVAEKLLNVIHSEVFVEMVEDIMHQVREIPGTMPVVRHPMDKALAGAVDGTMCGEGGEGTFKVSKENSI